ncbi:MAG: hypothetical protein CTY20_14950 [Hyphomicrobium sp.]|nr:MAG: hypothetical protein CTY20_14950 [Hyphomicrobium sp.]
MNWTDQIFRYCERGLDPSFWAEPLNALSNAGFMVAALTAGLSLARRPNDLAARPARLECALVAIVFAIGVGSFLFHTYATRWASVADTAPIGIFMLAYFAYAMRRFLGFGWLATALLTGGFILSLRYAGDVPCVPGLLPVTRAGGHPCFNGSLGYLPALAAVLGIGAILIVRGRPAGAYVLGAGLVFTVSFAFRTVDFEVCAMTSLLGKVRGTHALWHLLNALTLYLLLIAAIRHGTGMGGIGGGSGDRRESD